MGAAPLHAPVREDWLRLTREPILDPGRVIVDPHHHLWDRPEGRYLLPELLADIGAGHDVRATVYVQCRSMLRASGPEELRPVGEVEFANGVAAQAASGLYGRHHACAGIVAHADLTLGDRVEPVLEALTRAGGDRLRGIRVPVAWHRDDRVRSSPAQPPRGLMLDPRFQEGARRLARHGLSLDVWAYHTQLDEVFTLARACPEVVVVLDHLGGLVGVGPHAESPDEARAVWRAGLERLAGLDNVVLKLGGLGMRVAGYGFDEAARPPSSQELAEAWAPAVETGLSLFGAERCMFESNFPVDKGMVSYAVLWNAFKRLAEAGTEAEQDALFAGTALRVYRLDPELLR